MSWLCYGIAGLIFVFLLFAMLSIGSVLLRVGNRTVTTASTVTRLGVFVASSLAVVYLWSVLPPDRCLTNFG